MSQPVTRFELFGRLRGAPPARPPGAVAEHEFVDRCTRCDACLPVCPTGVLVRGPAGFPALDPKSGVCTSCGACAAACEAGCFTTELTPAAIAQVADTCLAARGVTCRTCEDQCEAAAIHFRPRLGGRSAVEIDAERCTGCGACVAPCPVDALSLVPRSTVLSSTTPKEARA